MAPAFNLTDADNVKAVMSSNPSNYASDDTLIGDLIASVSTQAERIMDRKVGAASYTEVLDIRAAQRMWELEAYPLTSITSVKIATDGDFASVDARDSDTYRTRDDLGLLFFYQPPYGVWRGTKVWQALQVVYTGGMAADFATFESTYPDIVQAVTRQVVYAMKRRNDPGATKMSSFGGGEVSHTGPYKLLPDVRDIFLQYRRQPVG